MFANVVGHGDQEDGKNPISLAAHVGSQFDQALSWHDIDWLRTFWDGPIVLKGIQTVADAKQAVAMGVQGIGLSNHGGRQLDDAPSPIELVEPVRQEIADQATIICDGGVRRGSDIVKAIALGADAVSVGRPYLYAPRRRRRTRRRPRPRVPPRRFRAHDGAHRLPLGRRDRSRSRPLAHRTVHLTPSPPHAIFVCDKKSADRVSDSLSQTSNDGLRGGGWWRAGGGWVAREGGVSTPARSSSS